MHWPVIESGPAAWQERILTLNWYQCPIKNWLVALKEALLLNFYGKKKKRKRKTKQNKNTQTNKKGKVEKGIQIIQE